MPGRQALAPAAIINFARMVEKSWLGIIRWFASQITNERLEGTTASSKPPSAAPAATAPHTTPSP